MSCGSSFFIGDINSSRRHLPVNTIFTAFQKYLEDRSAMNYRMEVERNRLPLRIHQALD